MKKYKQIPYGITDFERIKKENYYYIDKTRFIENIEKSPPYLFFIRPRRFGKSLWLSTMECYYDIFKKNDFEEIFKDTCIYDNQTKEKNSYFILKFNFSEVSSDINEVENSFNETIKLAGMKFAKVYSSFLKDNELELYNTIKTLKTASSVLKYIINFISGKGKIYLLIDEYDNFTNTIISSRGKEQYMAITHGEGFYRNFFNIIKAGTTGSGAPISKIFITGVSPVTMDDVTSGFNIGHNITGEYGFNEMAGFTEKEVLEMVDFYKEHGLITEASDKLIETMKKWYNNYLFSEDEKNKIFNSDMVLYFINAYIRQNKYPADMLARNIKTDYNKLKYLIIVDQEGKYNINGNFEKLKTIIEYGGISSDIIPSFPIERITASENFISLLYYLGLLTINPDSVEEEKKLIIPNEVIRQLYYEYIIEAYRDTGIFNIDFFKLKNLFKDMAYRGQWENLIYYLSEEMKKQISNRDYIQGEKAIQTFLRIYLNFSNYYITKTEDELNRGFCDILMLPHFIKYPEIKYSYLLEIKYISISDYNENKLNSKIEEAKKELEIYEKDESLNKLTKKTKLLKIILIFSGIELKYKEKI